MYLIYVETNLIARERNPLLTVLGNKENILASLKAP